MKVFPEWARRLGLGDCPIKGIDCKWHDDPEVYRKIVDFIKNDEHSLDLAPGEISFESVDSIIIEQIKNIESDFYDKGVLLEIYQSL